MTLALEIPYPSTDQESDASIAPAQSGLAELSEFYRQLGFERGYAQAARDQLEYSVIIAEQILREHAELALNPQNARRLLYAFVARMDRRLGLFADPRAGNDGDAYMEGGLGI